MHFGVHKRYERQRNFIFKLIIQISRVDQFLVKIESGKWNFIDENFNYFANYILKLNPNFV